MEEEKKIEETPKEEKEPFASLLKKRLKEINPLNFLFLTLAGVINAFGVTLFLFPVKLYDSGISGTSMLIYFQCSEFEEWMC